jgi:hypothetical protein
MATQPTNTAIAVLLSYFLGCVCFLGTKDAHLAEVGSSKTDESQAEDDSQAMSTRRGQGRSRARLRLWLCAKSNVALGRQAFCIRDESEREYIAVISCCGCFLEKTRPTTPAEGRARSRTLCFYPVQCCVLPHALFIYYV